MTGYTLNTVYTRQQLKDVVDFYSGVDEFIFDVETLSGTSDPEHRVDPRRNRVVWIALAHEGRVDVIPMQHPHGDYIRTEYPLLASGKSREAKGQPLRPQDYSKDERKATKIFGAPPAQLNPAEVFAALQPVLMNPRAVKGGHNVGFDHQSVAKYYGGQIPPLPFFDTMIAAFILDSRDKHYLGLDDCLKREFGHIMVKGVGKDISKHDFHTVERYAAEDAYWTWMLYQHYKRRLTDEMSDRVMRLDMDTLEGTLQMEMTGALIDAGALTSLKQRLEEEIEDAKGQVYAAAGKAFSINSNQVKQQLLFGPRSEGGRGLKGKILTDNGKKKRRAGETLDISDYSVSADALDLFAGMDSLVDALLAYADINKLMSTYVTPYMGGDVERTTAGKTKTVTRKAHMNNGRLHTQFLFTGAETGRFSSRNPNLQNVPNARTPNGKAIRDLFVAPPGCRLVVADYSQIEPRVMASFSEDPILMAAYLNGEDIYTAIASPFDLPRSAGKVIFLALSYGIGPEKLAADMGLKLPEAKGLMSETEEKFKTVYAYKRAVIKAAKSRRPVPYVKTLVGRRRYLPDLRLPDTRGNYGFISKAERQAFNTVIQGSAADIIKVAMVRAHRLIPDKASLILTVHDELVTVTPEDLADETEAAIREAMEGVQVLKVPLISEIKIVDRWGDGKA